MSRDSAVLVVDPDDRSRTQVSQLLRRAGYDTVQARTGEDALHAALERRPSLVLLEVVLPSTTGYEVCRDLREEFGAELPIVFISGARTEALDRVAGLLLGADDYIVKPFNPSELIARVKRLTDRSAPRELPPDSSLTTRELEVLKLLVAGLMQPEIARRLHISPKTVGKHIEHILAKLGVHSRTQAVAYAIRSHLV
jgi:two-component system, NarL family, nitrate/nitrite response regulator NarL